VVGTAPSTPDGSFRPQQNINGKGRMNTGATIVKVLDRLTDAMAFVAGIIIAFVMLLVSTSVILRQLSDNSLPWNIEISEYALLYACFLSAPWVMRLDAHVRVDFVVERLRRTSETACRCLERVSDGIVCLICLAMGYYGFAVAIDLWQRDVIVTSILNWPKAPLVVIIPIGLTVTLAQVIRRVVERERSKRTCAVAEESGEGVEE